MVTLYKLTEQQRELKEIAGNSDLPADAFDDTFKALEGQFNEKAESVIYVVKKLQLMLRKVAKLEITTI